VVDSSATLFKSIKFGLHNLFVVLCTGGGATVQETVRGNSIREEQVQTAMYSG